MLALFVAAAVESRLHSSLFNPPVARHKAPTKHHKADLAAQPSHARKESHKVTKWTTYLKASKAPMVQVRGVAAACSVGYKTAMGRGGVLSRLGGHGWDARDSQAPLA